MEVSHADPEPYQHHIPVHQATQVTPVKTQVASTRITPYKKPRAKHACTSMEHNSAKDMVTTPSVSVSHKCTQINLAPLNIDLISHSVKEMRQHTGLNSYELFKFVHTYLMSKCEDEQCEKVACKVDPMKMFSFLSTENQLLLTLFKLRSNTPESLIAKQMHIGNGSVSQIFKFWVKLMYRKFKLFNTNASLQKLTEVMPEEVKASFPNCREIFDATEINTQKPSDPIAQKLLWSNYKHGHTVKVQIGCSPSGVVSSVSDTYGGGTSDKKLFELSGIVDKFEDGEGIMVDKGYLIQDLLQGTGVELLRPPFLVKGSQFSEADRTEGRLIARHRGVIENVNSKIKSFKILSQKVPINMLPIINEIVFVCSFLTTLDKPFRK